MQEIFEKAEKIQFSKAIEAIGEVNGKRNQGAGRFRTPDTPIMWCVAELSEAWDGYRKNLKCKPEEIEQMKDLYGRFKNEPTEENRIAFVEHFASIKSSFEIEMLDCLLMMFDTISNFIKLDGENMEAILKAKLLYNSSRNDYKYSYDENGEPTR